MVSCGYLVWPASLIVSGRPGAFLQGAEPLRKADLIVLGQRLVAEQNNEMLVPGVENFGERRIRDILAQIDARNFGAQRAAITALLSSVMSVPPYAPGCRTTNTEQLA